MSPNKFVTDLCKKSEVMIRKQEDHTSPAASGSEAACARNAHGFMVQALGHLQDGNYDGYLCCLELAGQFARDARNDMYARRHP